MFTQDCILNKNTPEIREKLKGIGIFNFSSLNIKTDKVIQVSDGLFTTHQKNAYLRIKQNNPQATDCGTNEEMFLAISALRDDSDYMQWFVSVENWYMVTDNRNKFTVLDLNIWHKATVEELIKHFSK